MLPSSFYKGEKNLSSITLTRLTDDDREQFILDNQRAFKYGAMEEFGRRDDHFEEDGEIISRRTIENSIDGGVAYRIREDGRIVGGLVLKINEKTQHNELELLFVDPEVHSKGIGQAAWERQVHGEPQPKQAPPEKESIRKKLRDMEAEAKRRNNARRQQSRHDYDIVR